MKEELEDEFLISEKETLTTLNVLMLFLSVYVLIVSSLREVPKTFHASLSKLLAINLPMTLSIPAMRAVDTDLL